MVCCHLLGRDDEALHDVREGRKMFPEAADLLFEEGVLLMEKGALRDAQVNFEAILKLPPQKNYVGTDANMTGNRTRYNLALVYRGLGMPEKAAEQLLHILELTPEYGPAWLAVLEVYLGQKRMPDCERLLKRLEGKPFAEEIAPALHARMAVAKGDLVGAANPGGGRGPVAEGSVATELSGGHAAAADQG